MTKFPVVPLCGKQLKDINKQDVLNNGLFRLCNVYKGGGGYDKFPTIAKKRLGQDTDKQFVVQLKGCPLNCAYCYVTPDGVNGEAIQQTEEDLIKAFIPQFKRGVKVFHLMGGAPALYLDRWASVIKLLPTTAVFHSDLMLIERDYNKIDLRSLTRKNCLFAVSIKGNNPDEFYKKTKVKLNELLFWNNFDLIVKKKLNFYITFTGINPSEIKKKIEDRYGPKTLEDSFTIDLIEYEALKD